ncbi:hypothetical protein [Phenylobacterium sp.]|uniref:hypothetical protein n=1 Tax=Phenylobacterium sp. TaxID=1871053 RepID=UPI002FE3374B
MKIQVIGLAVAASVSAGAAQAASVEIRDAVARVTVIPEDRSDVRVEVTAPNPRLPLTIRTVGDRTVIDGDLDRRIRDCHGRGERQKIRVRGVGEVSRADTPQVVIRTPRNVELSADGAVSGVIGRSRSVSLSNAGCSSWTVADVAGRATIRESGAGSVRMGAAESLDVDISGAGSVHATRIRNGMDAELSGAGGVSVDELYGPVNADVSGVGKVRVAAGRASSLRASVSGIGGVEFDGPVGALNASISGMGGVSVKSVSGPVRKSVSGIGRVRIAEGS